jgi:8-oxo-dGTP diphosphatase
MKKTTIRDSRIYPALPVSGVGVVVYNKAGKILLIKRAKEPNKGRWSIPGGAIELGETINRAAEREVLEECSVKIKIERVLDAVENMVKDDKGRIKYHYVIIDLLARYISGKLKAGTDASECGWFTPGEITIMGITPLLRAMLERQGIIKHSS